MEFLYGVEIQAVHLQRKTTSGGYRIGRSYWKYEILVRARVAAKLHESAAE